MQSASAGRTYEIGDYRLDTAAHVLYRASDSTPLPLTPRVYDTLLFLVEHAGELLDKRRLIEAVWPNLAGSCAPSPCSASEADGMAAKHDASGLNYAELRRPDPRIAAAMREGLRQGETAFQGQWRSRFARSLIQATRRTAIALVPSLQRKGRQPRLTTDGPELVAWNQLVRGIQGP
jgi:hypothetical protein